MNLLVPRSTPPSLMPWHAPYSASKFGLRGVSEVLRFDLHRHDIGVSLVCPGAVDTGLVDTVEITGVNRATPIIQKLSTRFRERAVPPAAAAERILKGVEHFLQRRFKTAYVIVMRRLNDRFWENRSQSAVTPSAGQPVDR
jgi:NAD(P)-dependent dehydrogenase (short-subunit alcohol dehydrogenase family)